MDVSRDAGHEARASRTMNVLRFADCELRIRSRELWRDGKRQKIAKLVFDLLVYLIQRGPGAASHAEIARAVWKRTDVRAGVIAQAVLQARRATGDNPDEPALILSVRGVGYRFAGQPKVGVDAANEPEDNDDLARVRVAVEQALAAAERHDHDSALVLAENAIVLAEQAGAHALMARAMAIASWAALHTGTIELASRYAFRALRIAQAEEHRGVLAFARVRAAFVLYAAGDPQGALEMLEAVRVPDDVPPVDRTQLMCESLAAKICGDLQRFDDGRSWIDRALKSSLRINPEGRAVRERMTEVLIWLQEANAAEANNQWAHARQAFEKALALNHVLAHDCIEIGDAVDRICWAGNQGIALCGLGRLDEARHHANQAAQMLENWPNKASPWYAWHASEFAIQRAMLLHKAARSVEALECIQAAVAEAEAGGRLGHVARLSTIGSLASEALGDYRSAMNWTRRAQQAQQKQGLERMAKLASAYQASRSQDELLRELLATRTALASAYEQLQQMGAQLANATQQETAFNFLMAPDPFEFELKQRYFDAKARDLPCLVGAVELLSGQRAPAGESRNGHSSAMLAAAVKVRLHLGPANTRLCQWSDTTLLVTIQGVGIRRGTVVCEELQQSLNDAANTQRQSPPEWTFKVSLLDLTASDTFEAAMKALRL